MKIFYNFKIATKLIIGFVLVSIITAFMGYFGISNIKGVDTNYSNQIVESTKTLTNLNTISTSFQRSRVNIRSLILSSNLNEKNGFLDKIKQYDNKVSSGIENIRAVTKDRTILSQLDNLTNRIDKYSPIRQKVMDFAVAEKDKAAMSLMNGDGVKYADAVDEAITKLVSLDGDLIQKQSKDNSGSTNSTVNTMFFLIIFSIILSLGLGIIIARVISKPINKMEKASQKLAIGDVNVEINDDTNDEIGNLAKAFKEMIKTIKEQSVVAQKIALGDLSVELEVKSENDMLSKNLNMIIQNVKLLVSDADMLTNAALEGKLATRADASKHNGDYQKVVIGVNDTLDAVIGPLNVSADYVDKISKGNIPEKITDIYNGDFNTIKNNLNNCIDAVNLLVADANMLSKAAVEGKLATRADETKHNGDFRKIVEGVNNTLDAVIKPVKEASDVLQEIAKGNLSVKVLGNYSGDHATIKDAVNITVESLMSYISEISRVLNEMAKGNLDVSIDGDYRGDFTPIKESLNLIIKSFNQLLGDIKEAAGQVSGGSRQVSDSSQTLSQGSTEQASSIEEITSSVTQVAAQTKQNAESAEDANKLAMLAKGNAEKGNDQMKEMLNAMNEINESSGNISKIIKVIDEIAFQTNILALNAAVEAARAGQHGKGFAVVAEEVRNLAARSASAAKETTGMIENSIKKVEVGTEIATETAKALNNIVDGVAKAADLVSTIAAASTEQATGITQISQAIEQVAQVTQMNTATAEESAAASEELSSQAEILKNMVNKFKIKARADALNNIDSDMMHALQKMVSAKTEKKEEIQNKRPKVKISLDDKDFGKY